MTPEPQLTARPPGSQPAPRRWLAPALTAVLAVAYPALIYLGITRWSPRSAGFLVFGLAVCVLFGRLKQLAPGTLPAVVTPLLPALLLGLGTGLFGDQRMLLALPASVSLLLFIPFALSLRAGSKPMIQRFAELHRRGPDGEGAISAAGQAHCRRFTLVWVVFLALNTAVAVALALAMWVDWWLAYTCGISYALMGCLFLAERVARPHDPQLPQAKEEARA